ncbi:MAG: polysaccharide deacetylase family protein [Planctomyces sp.]|nr:polysaccharide deacetylase family protein [Planctomyces sp.]
MDLLHTNSSLARRRFLCSSAACIAGLVPGLNETSAILAGIAQVSQKSARVAVSLDLEMSRNFPNWEDTHWDYEKGNLDDATKAYAVEAARRVKSAGGRIHFFALGQTMEQENIDWLLNLISEGHQIGNHTYDHVNVTASSPDQIQFRFQRSPWLIGGKAPQEVVVENIQLAEKAINHRLGIRPNGFRTPGGFANGLRDRPDLQKLFIDLGYTWVSSLYPPHPTGKAKERPGRDVIQAIVDAQKYAQPFAYPNGLVEVPMSPVSDIGAFRTGRWPVEGFVEALEASIVWAIDNSAVFDFLAHPSCLVSADPEFRAIDAICRLVQSQAPRVEFATLDQIAVL